MLRRSRVGRAIVAVRLDRDAAVLMGVDVKSIYAIAFGLGAALAGCAGVLMALIFPISPLTSSAYLGKAFVVCVLGGLGSVSGALAGGLLLALVEGVGSRLARAGACDDAVVCAVDRLPDRAAARAARPEGFRMTPGSISRCWC